MKWTRRQFAMGLALLGLSGCARLRHTSLGQFAPNLARKKDRFLKFAAMSDLQLANAHSVGLVGRAVNAINNDPDIDFVVVIGSLTQGGTLPQMGLAYPALDRLEAPYFCLPGEQDQQPDASAPYANFQRFFKRTHWKENWGPWTFIGLDSPGVTDDSPTMPVENLVWLEEQLARLDSARPLVLCCPRPLNADGPGSPLENGADVLARFRYHNLRLVLTGGYRGNHVAVQNDITFISTACCSSVADNHDGTDEKGFRVFTVDGENIAHEFVSVAG